MAAANIPRLTKFDSETLSAYYERAEAHFTRWQVLDEYKAYDFMVGLNNDDYGRMAQAMLPKKVTTVKWGDLPAVINKIEGTDTNKSRLTFTSLKRKPGQSIMDFAAEVNALSLACNWDKFQGDEVARQLKFTSSFEEPHILEAIYKLDPNKGFNDMVQAAGTAQAIFDNSRSNTQVVAPVMANRNNQKQQFRSSAQKQNPKSNSAQEQKMNAQRPFKRYQRCRECFQKHPPSECPARNEVCGRCKKTGHQPVVCRSAAVAYLDESHTKETEMAVAALESSLGHYMVINTSKYSIDVNNPPVYITCVNDILACKAFSHRPVLVGVEVQGFPKPVEMLVDTGAGVSLLDKSLLPSGFNLSQLHSYNGVVSGAGGENIKVLGTLIASMSIFEGKLSGSLVIAEGMSTKAILGRDILDRIFPDWRKQFEVPLRARVLATKSEKEGGSSVPLAFPKLYPRAFHGKDNNLPIQSFTAHVHLKKDAVPVFQRARPVPLAMAPALEAHLSKLQSEGIIYPVTSSEWASPLVVVNKKDGGIRVCADFKRSVNKNIITDIYPPPLPEDIIADFEGCLVFSKIDLTNAYLQLDVHSSSRPLLTINTPMGLFRFSRLPFGLSSSPAIFQSVMDQVLAGIPRARAFLDDVLIGGKDRVECEQYVHEVLSRLETFNIKINLKKSVWFEKEIKFLGMVLSKDGKSPDPDKVAALVNMPPPKNPGELKSYLGLLNFSRSFLRDLSSTLEPLHALLRKGSVWAWSPECDLAFSTSKQLLVEATTLQIYNPEADLILSTDSSAYGVGAVLSQRLNGVVRPLAFQSATLNSAQRGYSSVHREALAIIFGLQKFHKYLFGRQFTIECDHQPLKALLSADRNIPAIAHARLIRWAEILSAYNYKIEYRPGNLIPHADAASRLPIPVVNDVEEVLFVTDSAPLVSLDEVRLETGKDPVSLEVIKRLSSVWGSKPKDPLVAKFFTVRDMLEVEDGVIFMNGRTVIPQLLRQKVLAAIHEGHVGITRMREQAKQLVWWPLMDQDVVSMVSQCEACNVHAARKPDSPNRLNRTDPSYPWERVHMDLFELDSHQFFLAIDAFSNWTQVELMPSATASNIILVLKRLMSTFGLFGTVVSDNGPPFSSSAFRTYLADRGIVHELTPPYNPQSNGRAEAAVHRAKQGIRKAGMDYPNLNLQERILHFMASQHAASSLHSNSPMSVILGYKPRTQLNVGRVVGQRAGSKTTVESESSFQPGSPVWFLQKPMQKHPLWVKAVVQLVSSTATRSVLTSSGSVHRAHITQLRHRSAKMESLGHPAVIPQPGIRSSSVGSESRELVVGQGADKPATAPPPGNFSYFPLGIDPQLGNSPFLPTSAIVGDPGLHDQNEKGSSTVMEASSSEHELVEGSFVARPDIVVDSANDSLDERLEESDPGLGTPRYPAISLCSSSSDLRSDVSTSPEARGAVSRFGRSLSLPRRLMDYVLFKD